MHAGRLWSACGASECLGHHVQRVMNTTVPGCHGVYDKHADVCMHLQVCCDEFV